MLHPFLTHYQTQNPDGSCTNTGTTGQWNAANGGSGGWQQFQVDLGAYAGRQIEVSITVLSDWGLQQFPGAFIDDIVVSTGEGTTSFEDDGDPMDGWTVPGAPQDDAGIEGPNRNDWVRRGGLGIKEGAAIATPQTIYLGHGFEGITGATTRNEIMDRVLGHLLPRGLTTTSRRRDSNPRPPLSLGGGRGATRSRSGLGTWVATRRQPAARA